MDMGLSCRTDAFFQASIKLTHPFPAPELRTKILRTRGLSDRCQEGKKLPKDKVFGRDIPGTSGPGRQDIPDSGAAMSQTKTLCKQPFSVVSDREWAGMSRDLGRDVPGSEKLYAREAMDLGNCPERKNLQKWLGEGATSLLHLVSKKPLAPLHRCKRGF